MRLNSGSGSRSLIPAHVLAFTGKAAEQMPDRCAHSSGRLWQGQNLCRAQISRSAPTALRRRLFDNVSGSMERSCCLRGGAGICARRRFRASVFEGSGRTKSVPGTGFTRVRRSPHRMSGGARGWAVNSGGLRLAMCCAPSGLSGSFVPSSIGALRRSLAPRLSHARPRGRPRSPSFCRAQRHACSRAAR